MAKWKEFTEDEVKRLRASPYVKNATVKMICFTTAFKEEFWRRYSEECQSPRKIVEELGFDSEVLGINRIQNISTRIKEQADNDDGFSEYRKISKKEAAADGQQIPQTKALSKMRTRIAYLEQEIEFIKKTIKADHEARRKR
jgi:hypothetical protein